MSASDSFLNKALGEDFFESLQKSFELYKPGTRTSLDPEEIKVAFQIVPRTLMSFLVGNLSSMKVGDNKRTELPLQEGGAFLNVTKLERDVYLGNLEQKGKIITDFKYRSLPGIGLVIMSAFELYDINKLIEPPAAPVEAPKAGADMVQKMIEERLALHDIVSQVVDKTMAEREALNKLMLRKLTEELHSTRDELERERVRLAGCGVAAMGAVKSGEMKPGDYGHSASLDDVVALREKHDKAASGIADIAAIAHAEPEAQKNTKTGEYFRGMANGLAVADAVLNNKEPKFVDKKGPAKLKKFIDDRKKPQEFSIEMTKGEHVNCPDCGKNIFDGSAYSGCICMGDDRNSKVFITKSDTGIKVRFGKGWDAENIEMLLEVLRKKRG